MRGLLELQRRFAGVVTGARDAAAVLPMIVDDAPGAVARIAIYANHYRVTLTEALATTFPVVVRLVGDDFFGAVARRYVREMPPCQPVVSAYGCDFPAFLTTVPEAASVPFLADVARLEWAINHASRAPDPETIIPQCPSGSDGFRVHPSCCMVCSPFAIDDIWQAHQSEDGGVAAVDVDAGPVRLLVGRKPDESVGWIRLPEAEAGFAAHLIAGTGLSDALTHARELDSAFEPVPFVAALIDGGFVRVFDHDSRKEPCR